jgi:hypothetical protein
MKPTAAFAAVLFAACSCAAELSPNLLRLIGADAHMVTGADLDRQDNSALKSEFRPQAIPDTISPCRALWIEFDTVNGPATLTVVIGAIPKQDSEAPVQEFTALDANTMVAGDPDIIREAQRRWTAPQPLSPLAAEARRLSQSYDNWFLLVKPFAVPAAMARAVADVGAPLMKYRQDLISAVEEISGGIRFAPVNELYLEAVFRNPEDASAAATLARWLPGILQLQEPYSYRGFLVDTIEDFTAHADGQRARISLRMPDDKVQAGIEAWASRAKAERK